jgi:HD-like signal output (HDOD) protein
MHSQIEAYLNNLIKGFPSLPAVVIRVMEITADAQSSNEDLCAVIQADQALSTNVLKMANSAFFGLPKRVGTLQHALAILGYAEIRNMVVTQAIFNSFKHIEKNGLLDLKPFWSHAFCCALASNIIRGHIGARNQDFYLPCLIHDIGKLLIFMALPEAYAELVKETAPRMHKIFELEERLFGITHAEVAQKLLSRWMFPDDVVQGIGFHHCPGAAKEYARIAWVVHAVDLLVHWSDLEDATDTPQAQELLQTLLHPEIAAGLGVGPHWNAAELATLKARLTDQRARQADILALFLS